jgi:hypothetical protein
MSIHPFDLRDLPTLRRYRDQSVFLNSALVLTRGPNVLTRALLSSLAPGVGIITAVSVENNNVDQVVIGQTMHASGAQCAHLTFFTPEAALELANLSPLLEYISVQAIERGAFRILAEANEDSLAFESLRQAGFAIYARQRVWRIAENVAGDSVSVTWQPATDRDLIPVRSLYNNLVPGLVQQAEPFPSERLRGLVYRQGDDLLAYVEVKYGRRGVWVQPFIHPDAEQVAGHLAGLFQGLQNRFSRPLYACVRTYQSWLEPAVERLGGTSGPRQAVMVRQLAVPHKAVRAYTLPVLEGGQPEPTASISRSQSKVAVNDRGEPLALCHNDE